MRAPKLGLKRYRIYEEVEYRLEAVSPQHAIEQFLADPWKYRQGVTDRQVYERTQGNTDRLVAVEEYDLAEDVARGEPVRGAA